MKYKFTQHIPNFVSADPVESSFSSLDELLNLEVVQRYTKDPEFFRFSLSRFPTKTYDYLMKELNNGYDWQVVGYVPSSLDILKGLPTAEKKTK